MCRAWRTGHAGCAMEERTSRTAGIPFVRTRWASSRSSVRHGDEDRNDIESSAHPVKLVVAGPNSEKGTRVVYVAYSRVGYVGYPRSLCVLRLRYVSKCYEVSECRLLAYTSYHRVIIKSLLG